MGDNGTGTTYQDFYLSEFNISTTSNLATIAGAPTIPISGDATVNITTVSASTMSNLFTFGSDSVDINSIITEDLLYKVNWTDNSNNPLDIDIDNSSNIIYGNMDSGVPNQNVTYDYVRYIALKLFNTVKGVKLITNQSSLRSNLKNKLNVGLNNKLIELAALDPQTENDITNNPARSVMKQIIHNDPGRFHNISGELYYGPGTNLSGNTINMYKVPFIKGDRVYFNVTFDADESQHTIVNRPTAIQSRTYLFKLTLQ
jgi:hypothetical protein